MEASGIMNPIREAIKRLPGHWYQGSFYDPDNIENACGLGHVHMAIVEENNRILNDDSITDLIESGRLERMYDVASKYLADAARDKFPDRTEGLKGVGAFPAFNDNEETTEDEVIAVMELAADRWDVEHEG